MFLDDFVHSSALLHSQVIDPISDLAFPIQRLLALGLALRVSGGLDVVEARLFHDFFVELVCSFHAEELPQSLHRLQRISLDSLEASLKHVITSVLNVELGPIALFKLEITTVAHFVVQKGIEKVGEGRSVFKGSVRAAVVA